MDRKTHVNPQTFEIEAQEGDNNVSTFDDHSFDNISGDDRVCSCD
jgi:hypothetical protein